MGGIKVAKEDNKKKIEEMIKELKEAGFVETDIDEDGDQIIWLTKAGRDLFA